MSSLPLETQLTLENFLSDFESAKEDRDYEKAREIIKALREYNDVEAQKLQEELFNFPV